ncbi:glutathione S-transferase [Mycena galopus ATCC 62051]|nr:glutathione S-transferase [Mycena galopus ATCC 62051]
MAFQSNKPIVLYTLGTPNGLVASIFLEELKYLTIFSHSAVKMSISDAEISKVHNQVKSPWFLEINPNGRIPAITHEGTRVFETSAILVYLAQIFDKERKFSKDPSDLKAWAEEQSWIYFSHGGVGPMQGQANHFNLFAPEKIPYATKRYLDETKRLYSVLESALEKSEYLAGPTLLGVRIAPRTGVDLAPFPKLSAWVKKIEERPAVKEGLAVPRS